jgi:hypothetical protein
VKFIRSLALLSALLATLATDLAAMDNKAVIKMKNAGLTDDTIVLAMQKEKPEYDTSTDGLIELKQAGISETIIQKMLKLQAGDSTPPAAPSGDSPAAGREDGFYGQFPAIAPPMIQPVVGKNYFTRFTLHQEKNTYSTTNYARGDLVPINTPVTLVSFGKDKITLKRLDNGNELKVENEEKYTKKSAEEFSALMLSDDKTPLDQLPPKVASAVQNGELHKGMTKELALMTRGYPPAHETSSTDNDSWIFWSSRFVKQTVVFSNGRLSEGRGIN